MAQTEDVNIQLNVLAGAMGGITAISSGMSALTSTFGEFGTQAVDNFGAIEGLLVSSAALVGVFGLQAAEAFGEFEQGMKIVQTVSGQSSAAIRQLSDQANQLSVEYRTAIGDITDGLQTLGRAGLNSADSQIEVLRSGLQTAKLEGRSLNGVLEEIIQNTAMLGGDLKSASFGSQSEYLNSLMVGTSMTAPIDSHDISQTLQYSGGTMAAAGGRIDTDEGKEIVEDYMGTVAAFAQKGVKGSMAGTALRAFFTKPASQDKSVTDALETLNLEPEDLWEDGGNSMKKVSDQIGVIKGRMDELNLSTMDQVELWGKIVGPKMGQQMMKLDAESIKDLTKDIQGAQSAEELATQTLQTYNQKVSELQQQGQSAFRSFGSHIVTFLTPAVDIISKIMGLFSHPVVSTAVFGGAVALISHGIHAAYNMVRTLAAQIRALISEAMQGFQAMSGSASNFGGGIQTTGSQVDVLNAKLKETNAELQAIQAQSLGIRNFGYMAPGMSTTDKVDKGVIKTAQKEIFEGTGIIGAKGEYYERNEIDDLVDEAKKKNKTLTKSQISQEIEKGRTDARVDIRNVSGEEYTKLRDSVKGRDDALSRFIVQKNKDLQNSKVGFKDWNANGRYTVADVTPLTKKTFEAELAEQSAHSSKLYSEQANAMKNSTKSVSLWGRAVETGQKRTMGYVNALGKVGGRIDSAGAAMSKSISSALPQSVKNAFATATKPISTVTKSISSATKPISASFGLIRGAAISASSGLNAFVIKTLGLDKILIPKAMAAIDEMKAGMQTSSVMMKASLDELSQATGLTAKRLKLIMSEPRAMSVMDDVVAKKKIAMSQALDKLSQATGLTGKQLENLILSSEELSAAFKDLGVSTAYREFNTSDPDKILKKSLRQSPTSGQSAIGQIWAQKVKDTKFGSAMSKVASSTGKAFSGLGKAVSGITGLMGGPFAAAIMGVTIAMQLYQKSVEDYQKRLEESTKKISNAVSDIKKTEEKINKDFEKENPKATDEQKEENLEDKYLDIEESGYNLQALEENTAALGRATEAYKQGVKDSAKQTTDPGEWYSQKGISTTIADMNQWGRDLYASIFDKDSFYQTKAGSYYSVLNSGYLDENSVVLLDTQKDEKYPWLKEFSPILAADVWKTGSIEKGVSMALGDSYPRIADRLHSQNFGQNGYLTKSAFGENAANVQRFFGSGVEQNKLQMAFKNYGADFKRLGHMTRGYEKRAGRSALYDFQQGMNRPGPGSSAQKGLDALRKAGKKQNDKLINFISNLHIKTGLTEQQVLMAAQLAQLQEMQQIANETVKPHMEAQTAEALNLVAIGGSTNAMTGEAAGGAQGAAGNAAAIATLLGAMMDQKLMEGAQNDAISKGVDGAADMTENQFRARAQEAWEKERSGLGWLMDPTDKEYSSAYDNYVRSGLVAKNKMAGYDGQAALDKANQDMYDLAYSKSDYLGFNGHGLRTALEGTMHRAIDDQLATNILAQYDATDAMKGSGKGGSGGSGGGGGGGGSGGKGSSDSGSGTKKERVDLVLCNKKEIPKLNVNLFKKPPSFTILNKNFKLRDIKINSQDKPKTIMNAIKNGIIDTQKRMDPKIIQDETGVYDPVEATEGSSSPRGTTKTTT